MKNALKKKMLLILAELFYVSGAGLVIFYILELLFPGMILAYFNLNLLLIFWLIIGIVVVVKK